MVKWNGFVTLLHLTHLFQFIFSFITTGIHLMRMRGFQYLHFERCLWLSPTTGFVGQIVFKVCGFEFPAIFFHEHCSKSNDLNAIYKQNLIYSLDKGFLKIIMDVCLKIAFSKSKASKNIKKWYKYHLKIFKIQSYRFLAYHQLFQFCSLNEHGRLNFFSHKPQTLKKYVFLCMFKWCCSHFLMFLTKNS